MIYAPLDWGAAVRALSSRVDATKGLRARVLGAINIVTDECYVPG